MAHAPRSNTRLVIGFSVVVLLHILLIWGLKYGLASSLVDMLKGPMEASLIEAAQQEKVAPPPPPPKFQPPPPVVDIPVDISIEAPPTENDNTIHEQAKPKAAPVVAAPVITVPPRSNPRHPVSQPDYPPTSKRLGEHGTVVMLLTIDETGKVVDAKVDHSSGYDRLDQAAIDEAVKNWRLLPATVGGKPVQMTYKFAVVFKIEDQ